MDFPGLGCRLGGVDSLLSRNSESRLASPFRFDLLPVLQRFEGSDALLIRSLNLSFNPLE